MKTRVWIQDWRTGYYRRKLQFKLRWDRDDGQPELYGNVLSVHFAVWRERPRLVIDIETSRPDYLKPDVGDRRFVAYDLKTRSPMSSDGTQEFFYRMGMALFDANEAKRQVHDEVVLENRRAMDVSPEAYAELNKLISSEDIEMCRPVVQNGEDNGEG